MSELPGPPPPPWAAAARARRADRDARGHAALLRLLEHDALRAAAHAALGPRGAAAVRRAAPDALARRAAAALAARGPPPVALRALPAPLRARLARAARLAAREDPGAEADLLARLADEVELRGAAAWLADAPDRALARAARAVLPARHPARADPARRADVVRAVLAAAYDLDLDRLVRPPPSTRDNDPVALAELASESSDDDRDGNAEEEKEDEEIEKEGEEDDDDDEDEGVTPGEVNGDRNSRVRRPSLPSRKRARSTADRGARPAREAAAEDPPLRALGGSSAYTVLQGFDSGHLSDAGVWISPGIENIRAGVSRAYLNDQFDVSALRAYCRTHGLRADKKSKMIAIILAHLAKSS
jgi:hypothetical protein